MPLVSVLESEDRQEAKNLEVHSVERFWVFFLLVFSQENY